MKTLWLASWYPSKISPFNGDFIKRHAEAVSLFEDVHVIHVVRDEKGQLTKNVLIEESMTGRLTETIIYYFSPKSKLPVLNKINSERKYRRIYKQAVEDYMSKNGKPAIIHVHVGMKAGVIAAHFKKQRQVQYVITEHWSGFLPEAKEKFTDLPFYVRRLWKKVMKHAAACSAVSNHLAAGIRNHFGNVQCKVIPNVVNTAIFNEARVTKTHPQFIHISGLHDLKNPEDILRAFAMVKESHSSVRLSIFGSTREKIVQFAADLGLRDHVSFSEEVPQTVLAAHINQSDALLLYSSYETFGCVVIEANACGVPVIVSDIPVFHETVKEGENGFFVQPANIEALAAAMIRLIENRSLFDSKAIAATTGLKYSYTTVGKQFSEWYREMRNNQ